MAKRAFYDNPAIDTSGNALSGAQVTVYLADGTTVATIYGSKTGAAISNPIVTGSNGLVQFWAAPGEYVLKWHDPTIPARFSDRTTYFESVSGDTGGIDGVQLEDAGIDALQLNANSVGNSEMQDNAITQTEMGDGSVGEQELTSSVAAKLGVSQTGIPRQVYAEALAEVTLNSGTITDLGGPSVTLNVPATNSLIEFRILIDVKGTSGSTQPDLYINDGTTDMYIGGMQPGTTYGTATYYLLSSGIAQLKFASYNKFISGFTLTGYSGTVTFSLRYARVISSDTAFFKNRKLWARVIGF